MTGYFVRIVDPHTREVLNVEVDQMTDPQLEKYIERLTEEEAKSWFKALAKWVRDNVRKEDTDGK